MSKEVSESAFEYLLAEILSLKLQKQQSEDELSIHLEKMGYEVGFRYIEKICPIQKVLSSEHLDIVKFVCKDLWEELFKKKIDKLQTNHRGVFVLSDFKFKWLERYSFTADPSLKLQANKILQFACGILRGSLTNLGLPAIVTAEYTNLPSCTFNVLEMFGDSNIGSRHEDLLSATPATDELKRHLVSEIKNRAKGILESSKNYPEVIQLYSKAIEIIPSNSEGDTMEKSVLYANRSMCHSGMKKFSDAEVDANLSINLNPLYTKAYYRKTVALVGLRKHKEARSCIMVGLEQIPGDKELTALLNKVETEIKTTQPTATSTSTSPSISNAALPTKNKVVPQKAPPKASTSKKEDGDESEEANEDEMSAAKDVVRGYKKLADGRVTTFFNNTLDEQTKALIGDIAPKKLDSAVASDNSNVVGSSWNSAGTFESRDLTAWAKSWLQSNLGNDFLGGSLKTSGSYASANLSIKEVKDLNGDAEIIVTRGKRKYVCDFSFTIVFQIVLMNSDGSEKLVDASLFIEDVTADLGYESSFTVTTKIDANEPAIKAGKAELSNRLKTQLELFVKELISKT